MIISNNSIKVKYLWYFLFFPIMQLKRREKLKIILKLLYFLYIEN